MITKATVFILGAGAGIPYGFPLGSELKKDMLDILDKDNLDNRSALALLAKAGGQDYEEMRLLTLRKTLQDSGDGTIDTFLETHEEYKDTAKRVIAYILLKKEIRDNVMHPIISEGQKPEQNSDWYPEILRMMQSSGVGQFTSNKVSFITFNYDRSLEHFFYAALTTRNRPQVTTEAWVDVIRKIPIVHIHGDLGAYYELGDKNDPARVGFNTKITELTIRLAGERIRVIHEKDAMLDQNYKSARSLVQNAQFVFFLGFGYDERNLRRLQLKPVLNPQARVEGTGLGLTPAIKARIQSLSGGVIHQDSIREFNCLAFLRESHAAQQIYEIH